MGFVIAQVFWFDSRYGFAHTEGGSKRIFFHEYQRIHPYSTPDGVRYTRCTSRRQGKRGLMIRIKIESCSKGLRASEWMYLDDYEKAKAHVKHQRKERSKKRGRSNRRRQFPNRRNVEQQDRLVS